MEDGAGGAAALRHAAEAPRPEAALIRHLIPAELVVPAPVANPAIHNPAVLR
jgi:hypothetical protein